MFTALLLSSDTHHHYDYYNHTHTHHTHHHHHTHIIGWVRTIREQKNFAFVEVNDGSILTSMQNVVDSSIDSYGEVSKLSTGKGSQRSP
jgi:aspartyl/asparaginyl-tRNA synthetase